MTLDEADYHIRVPLTDFVKQVSEHAARETARVCLKEHKAQCRRELDAEIKRNSEAAKAAALAAKVNADKIVAVQLGMAKLVGMLVGSGLLGGGVVLGAVKLLGL